MSDEATFLVIWWAWLLLCGYIRKWWMWAPFYAISGMILWIGGFQHAIHQVFEVDGDGWWMIGCWILMFGAVFMTDEAAIALRARRVGMNGKNQGIATGSQGSRSGVAKRLARTSALRQTEPSSPQRSIR